MTSAKFEAIGREDPRIATLFAAFIRETDGPLGIDLEREIAAGLPRDLVSPSGAFFLVAVDGEPAGFGGIRHLHTDVAEVKSMYVAPGHRGKGLARALLAELEEIGREHGCLAVRLDTSDYLTEAIGLYRAAGYREASDYNANPKANRWFERSLADEPILLLPYDDAWQASFERERVALEAAIGPWIAGGVNHVGSTAVPGLDAKPIIDILVGVESLQGSQACFGPLADLGYLHAPYCSEEMHWLCKPHPSRRTHHLHLIPVSSPRYADELAFRDRLRADPRLAREYADLKQDLAARFPHDRDSYTDAKADFIQAALGQL